jgi:hypothetical protein
MEAFMIKKRLLVLLTSCILLFVFSTPAFADESAEMWKPISKSKPYETKAKKWKSAVRRYYNGKGKCIIKCDLSKKVCSTYSGELKISIPKLESYALMNHEIKKSFSTRVSDNESLTGKSKGTYEIQWREVYTTRKVVQQKYVKVDKQWRKSTVKEVYPKDFKCVSFRLKKISKKDIT